MNNATTPPIDLLTDVVIDPNKTEETGETATPSNSDFLSAIFCSSSTDSRPMIISFSGHPNKVAKASWYGRPWLGQDDGLGHDSNNYFSLATFRADESGQYRRIKDRFVALHAIMLDDLGGKIAMDRLTLPPSWLLESSSGNHQAGYFLKEPLTDGVLADRLIKAIIAAGLCDPGANGPRTRLARLPEGVNGKHSPPFQCRMVSWSPDLRYSVEELVSGLQVVMTEPGRPKRHADRASQNHSDEGETVWIPKPDENAVLAALRDRGLYKVPLGDGKHEVTCPWVDAHTGKIDGGSAYFEPDDSWPIGGFKCLHGHCADRRIRDLLNYLNIEINAARMKSTIRVIAGEIHRVVDVAEEALAQCKRYYQRGGLITTVTTDPGTRDTKIQEISLPALVRALSGVATWERYDARAKDWIRTDPPARHASVLFDSTSYLHLPVVSGLARQPYLRSDGSMMTVAGYDAETWMFGVFDSRAFSIPAEPTREDAEKSLAMLSDLLAEFSFASKADFAATLTAILTASTRPSLPTAPMFHVKAHMIASGKSYLCELIAAFATPQRGTPTSFPADDEECRKLLLAELLRSPAVVEFDNLTSDLVAHKSLCTALTSEHMSGRILGVSKTATVGTRTLFLSSGNNVGPVQDMTRRCITVKLSPQCEIPAARTFKRPELIREVLQERGRYVSAALTIIRAWIVAGRPKTACKALAGYGVWSDLCRQPILWLGCSDPTASVFEAMAEDPDRETLVRFLEAWWDAFGTVPTMIREAVSWTSGGSDSGNELREVLLDIAGERGEINRRKLGWWIRRHAGRILESKRITRAAGNGSAERWRAEIVEPVSPVS
jgi:hypothetical protein